MVYLQTDGKLKHFSLQVKVCDTFLKRLLGALPRGEVKAGEALLFPGARWIHTLFMRRAIDVVYFDSRGRIISCFSAVPPFRLLPPSTDAVGALELPPETLPVACDSREFQVRFPPDIAKQAGYPELNVENSP